MRGILPSSYVPWFQEYRVFQRWLKFAGWEALLLLQDITVRRRLVFMFCAADLLHEALFRILVNDIEMFLFSHFHNKSGWPSGLRRCVKVAVYICRRGFKSHFRQTFFPPEKYLYENYFFFSVRLGYLDVIIIIP